MKKKKFIFVQNTRARRPESRDNGIPSKNHCRSRSKGLDGGVFCARSRPQLIKPAADNIVVQP